MNTETAIEIDFIVKKDGPNVNPIDRLINIADYQCYLNMETIPKMHEIIVEEEWMDFVINFPVTKECHFTYHSWDKKGFTLQNIVHVICEKYIEIFREEAKTHEGPIGITPTGHREKSYGCWGIYRYFLEELYLYGIERKIDGRWEVNVIGCSID